MTLQEKIQKRAEGYGELAPVFLEGANFALKNQWISVKDKLPQIQPGSLWSKKVICAPKYGYDVYINRYGGRYRNSDIGWSGNNVAYWMPLPELPKE